MKNIFFCTIFFSTILLQAQSSNPIPRFLIGLETNAYFEDITYRKNNLGYVAIGLQIEKPIGQFSFGTALVNQRFGQQLFRQFTGEIIPTENTNVDTYGYFFQNRKLSFWNIPLRLQFRLPCNCVYLQAGLQTSIRQLKTVEGGEYWNSDYRPPSPDIYNLNSIRKISLGYELGIGLNFHLSDRWKMSNRLTYTHYGYFKTQDEQFRELGNAFLGLNLSFQRAIY